MICTHSRKLVFHKVSVLIADVYSGVNFEGLQICPHFTDFEFTNWTRNGEVLPVLSVEDCHGRMQISKFKWCSPIIEYISCYTVEP